MKRYIFTALIILFQLQVASAAKKKVNYKIRDKIFLVTHPLMKQATRQGDTVTFVWDEPHHDFKYFLEIYREGLKKPISSIPVSGGEKLLRFKKKEKKKLYWRILALSSYGNQTRNKKAMLVPLKYD